MRIKFISLWNYIKSLFKSPAQELPVLSAGDSDMHRIALVVGHNKVAQGATSLLGYSEFEFYSVVAPIVQAKLVDAGYECAVLYRPTGSYSGQVRDIVYRVKRFGADAVICMHFNSFNRSVQGTETLIMNDGHESSYELASAMSYGFHSMYDLPLRGFQGIKKLGSRDRGAGMLYGLRELGVTACLIEPFFGDTVSSMKIMEEQEKFAAVIADSIIRGL